MSQATAPGTPITEDPIGDVRRVQRDLSLGVCRTPAEALLSWGSWQYAAEILTRQFFPRYVRKDLDAVELIEQAYQHALYWYPLIQAHLPGTYGPGWTPRRVVAWLCESVGGASGRWQLAPVSLPERGEEGIRRATDNALQLPGTHDPPWAERSLTELWRIACSGGIKARLASLVYDPIAYADTDSEWEEPPSDLVRLRLGPRALLVANEPAARRHPDLPWIDLTASAADVLDYRVRLTERSSRLEVSLRPALVSQVKSRLQEIASGAGSTRYRIDLINDALRAFQAAHGWAEGATMQFASVHHHAQRLLRQHLGPHPHDALQRISVGPRIDPLEPAALTDPDCPEGAWRGIFSPYR